MVSTYQVLTTQLLSTLGRDHPQGSGLLKHTPCSVVFTGLVPVDIDRCPYILFTSHGVHQHAPPSPYKLPEKIFQGVKQIIRNIRDPSLTTGKYFLNTW